MKRLVSFLGLVVASLFIASCGGGISSTNTYDDYSVNINVKELRYNNTSNIESIVLDVENSTGTQYVNALAFTKSGADWTIALPPLPLGEALTFTAHALNTNSTIYEATSTNTLINGANVVNLELQEVLSNTNSIPTIKSVTTDTANSIMSLEIFNLEQQDIAYSIASGDFTFTPNSGTITGFTAATKLLDVSFSGPTTPATYSDNWIELTNSEGDTFITTFDIVIADNSSVSVVINMPPNVSAIAVDDKTNAGQTSFSVTATDPEADALTYSWSVTDDAGNAISNAISGDTTSTLVIDGLDTSVDKLKLSVTVTDAKGSSSSVNYTLN